MIDVQGAQGAKSRIFCFVGMYVDVHFGLYGPLDYWIRVALRDRNREMIMLV